jgi:hypothetical protein
MYIKYSVLLLYVYMMMYLDRHGKYKLLVTRDVGYGGGRQWMRPLPQILFVSVAAPLIL